MSAVHKQGYSGRFVLRIATDLHESLAVMATERGVSLNQFVQNLLSSHVAGVTTAEYCLQQAFAGSLAKLEERSEIYIRQIEQQARIGKEADLTSGEKRT